MIRNLYNYPYYNYYYPHPYFFRLWHSSTTITSCHPHHKFLVSVGSVPVFRSNPQIHQSISQSLTFSLVSYEIYSQIRGSADQGNRSARVMRERQLLCFVCLRLKPGAMLTLDQGHSEDIETVNPPLLILFERLRFVETVKFWAKSSNRASLVPFTFSISWWRTSSGELLMTIFISGFCTWFRLSGATSRSH